jgi:hypothetical protein
MKPLRPTLSAHFAVAAAVAALALPACSTDDAESETVDAMLPDAAPPPPVDRRPVRENVLAAAGTAVEAVPMHAEPISLAIARWAHVVPPPVEAVGGRDLTREEEGHEGTLSFDIDADGAPESLHSFVPDRAEYAFLAWEDRGFCHLTWERYDITRYVFSACNGAAEAPVHICATPVNDARTCQTCTAGECTPCDAHIEDGQVVCTPFDDGLPEPDAGPLEPDARPADEPDFGRPDEPDGGGGTPGINATFLLAFHDDVAPKPRRVEANFLSTPTEHLLEATFHAFAFAGGQVEDWGTAAAQDPEFGDSGHFSLTFMEFSLANSAPGMLMVQGDFLDGVQVCGTFQTMSPDDLDPPVAGVFAGAIVADPLSPEVAAPPPCE